MTCRSILGMRVDATSYLSAASSIIERAQAGLGGYVCIANVHMAMESFDSSAFRRIVNEAFLVTPDGMPLVWALRLLGVKDQQRVYGPELTLRICELAETKGVPLGLYGGTPEHLEEFIEFLRMRFPGLRMTCAIAPPFRPLTEEEDRAYTEQLVAAGVQVVLVGIGCPKQEGWMAHHRSRIPAVLVGVGAAFDFFSGRVKQAPPWVQRIGMEWCFRLLMEPRRLWKRYLKHNPRFVLLLLLQLLGIRRFEEASR